MDDWRREERQVQTSLSASITRKPAIALEAERIFTTRAKPTCLCHAGPGAIVEIAEKATLNELH
jgi:hypothetical protein